MSYYSDASLVMIPSGVKNGTVFSQKPLSSDGELTFTRSNDTATRVGPDGLIEKVRTNLALYSEQLDNAYWIKAGAPVITVTANAGTAPDGTTTADRCSATSVGTPSRVYTDVTWGGGEHTLSLYVKNNGGTNTSFRFSYYDSVDQYFSPTFTLTNEWQRITFTFSPAAGAGGFWLVNTPIASGNLDLLAWGAQLETGVATDYIATTSAAVSVGPVANLPRLDYLGSSCPRLLLEPQRTNSFLYSEQFDNAGWTKSDVTITANTTATLDPSGYYGSDKLVENTANSVHRIAQTAILTSGQVYTQSVFAKDDGSGRYLRIFRASSTYNVAVFNLTNGTISSQSGSNLISAKIEAYGNNWYRCSITFTAAFSNIASYIALQNGLNDSYTGDGTSGIFIYGAALELGSYATSYIGPTLGAAVTRLADAAYKTGISSLIGQTEGTLYWEGVRPEGANDTSAVSLSDTTTNNEVTFRFTAVDTVEFYLRSGGSQTVASTYTGADLNQNTKIAFAYKANDVAVYVNGTLVVLDTSATVPVSLTAFKFSRGNNSTPMIASVSQALLFKTRLSNAKLAELTTL